MAKRQRPEAMLTEVIQGSIIETLDPSWVYKIPDIPVPGTGKSSVTRFVLSRPFDLMIVARGVPIAMEVKVHTSHTAFPFSRVEDHQCEALSLVEQAGGTALVGIGIMFSLEGLPKKYELPANLEPYVFNNRVWAFAATPYGSFQESEYTLLQEGKKSMQLSDLAPLPWATKAGKTVLHQPHNVPLFELSGLVKG